MYVRVYWCTLNAACILYGWLVTNFSLLVWCGWHEESLAGWFPG
jgi:hypothetical protein